MTLELKMFNKQETPNPNKKNSLVKTLGHCRKNKTVLIKHGTLVLKLFLMVAAK